MQKHLESDHQKQEKIIFPEGNKNSRMMRSRWQKLEGKVTEKIDDHSI